LGFSKVLVSFVSLCTSDARWHKQVRLYWIH